MRKPCTFEELPEQLRSEITTQSDFNVSQGEKPYQVTQCSANIRGDNARCFVRDDGVFGIFDLSRKCVTTTWIGSHEVRMLSGILESTRP